MAEDFELVRSYRQHLKRGAALLDDGKFDEALHEVEQALALDAHSLPAQALRDRIRAVKMRSAPGAADSLPQPSRGFVPQGVNAASWRGFEQRITERRMRALLDTANSAIVAGDPVAARVALEEARDLRPDAPELVELETRLAAVPITAAPEPLPAPRIWMRAMGAAAMFLIGVSLLIGVEWLRPIDTITPSSSVLTAAPDAAPSPGLRTTDASQTDAAIIEIDDDDESVPAIIMPPEPLLQPRGTTGSTIPATETRPVARNDAPVRPAPAAPEPLVASAEISDDFVVRPDVARAEITDAPAAALDTTIARADAASAPAATAPAPAVERPAVETRPSPPPAVMRAAAAPVVPEQNRVQDVLRRYASAYGALDASAARAVWPSVDEKALARAFQNLSSQDVSFDDCDIRISGAVANASCRGQASYVGKVGSREQRTESRTWQFELRREGDDWLIQGVDARRLSTSAASYRDR